jgi:hypothetical protein
MKYLDSKYQIVHLLIPKNSVDPAEILGAEVMARVFADVDLFSLLRAGGVNRTWRRFTLDDQLWHRPHLFTSTIYQNSFFMPPSNRGRGTKFSYCYIFTLAKSPDHLRKCSISLERAYPIISRYSYYII